MRRPLYALPLLLTLTAPLSAQLLVPGRPAPELTVSEWLQGPELNAKEMPRVYVVEFWAAWCQPCLYAMPHMSELYRRFEKRGLRIVGITVEDPQNSLDDVRAVVKRMAPKDLAYGVAFDKSGKSGRDWLDASGQEGIPCAFLVLDGKIAWVGHPLDGLDERVEDALDGCFDLRFAYVTGSDEMRERYVGALLGSLEELRAFFASLPKELPASPQLTAIEHTKLHRADAKAAAAFFAERLAAFEKEHPLLALAFARFVLSSDASEESYAACREYQKKLAAEKGPYQLRAAMHSVQDAIEAENPDEEAVARAAEHALQVAHEDAAALGRLASLLANAEEPTPYAKLASAVIDRWVQLAPESLPARGLRFQLLFSTDATAEKIFEVGSQLLALLATSEDVNGFVWTILTEDPFAGRCQKLALSGAQRLLREKELSAAIWDTIALAFFENGKVDEAIAHQKKAIELAEDADEREGYEETLERYLEAKKK